MLVFFFPLPLIRRGIFGVHKGKARAEGSIVTRENCESLSLSLSLVIKWILAAGYIDMEGGLNVIIWIILVGYGNKKCGPGHNMVLFARSYG